MGQFPQQGKAVNRGSLEDGEAFTSDDDWLSVSEDDEENDDSDELPQRPIRDAGDESSDTDLEESEPESDDDDISGHLPSEDVERAKRFIRKRDRYSVRKNAVSGFLSHRSVCLCGRTRVGKSTCVRVLEDCLAEPVEESIFSETVTPLVSSLAVTEKRIRTSRIVREFAIEFIEVPGLNRLTLPQGQDMADVRRVESIAELGPVCLDNGVTDLNCILYFTSLERGLRKADARNLRALVDLFGVSPIRMGLVVSRSDFQRRGWQERMNQVLKLNSRAGSLVREHFTILYTGCVNSSMYATYGSLLNEYKEVYRMREKILSFIYRSEEPVELLREKPFFSRYDFCRKDEEERVSWLMETSTPEYLEFAEARIVFVYGGVGVGVWKSLLVL